LTDGKHAFGCRATDSRLQFLLREAEKDEAQVAAISAGSILVHAKLPPRVAVKDCQIVHGDMGR
jgi:hypothetical protein